MKKRVLLPGVAGIAIILGLFYIIGVAASPWAEAPGLSVEMKAVGEYHIIYNITLVNNSSSAIGDIFVAGTIPAGGTFQEAMATPSGCGFKAAEAGSAVWLCSRVAPNSSLGPLSYRVAIGEKVGGPAHAWVNWKVPSQGSAMSPDVAFSEVEIDLPKRGCTDCHSLRDPNTGAVTIAYEAMHRGGPNHPKLDFDTPVTRCLGCHAPGTGDRENMGVVAPKMLRDIVHPAHLNSPTFLEHYKGNCFTCHNVDGQGRFTLLGVKLDKDFRGIPKTTPVQGILPSETTR